MRLRFYIWLIISFLSQYGYGHVGVERADTIKNQRVLDSFISQKKHVGNSIIIDGSQGFSSIDFSALGAEDTVLLGLQLFNFEKVNIYCRENLYINGLSVISTDTSKDKIDITTRAGRYFVFSFHGYNNVYIHKNVYCNYLRFFVNRLDSFSIDDSTLNRIHVSDNVEFYEIRRSNEIFANKAIIFFDIIKSFSKSSMDNGNNIGPGLLIMSPVDNGEFLKGILNYFDYRQPSKYITIGELSCGDSFSCMKAYFSNSIYDDSKDSGSYYQIDLRDEGIDWISKMRKLLIDRKPNQYQYMWTVNDWENPIREIRESRAYNQKITFLFSNDDWMERSKYFRYRMNKIVRKHNSNFKLIIKTL